MLGDRLLLAWIEGAVAYPKYQHGDTLEVSIDRKGSFFDIIPRDTNNYS